MRSSLLNQALLYSFLVVGLFFSPSVEAKIGVNNYRVDFSAKCAGFWEYRSAYVQCHGMPFDEEIQVGGDRCYTLGRLNDLATNLCSEDNDEDGLLNFNDNCPDVSNEDQVDVDGNGIGDACYPLDMADGVLDEEFGDNGYLELNNGVQIPGGGNNMINLLGFDNPIGLTTDAENRLIIKSQVRVEGRLTGTRLERYSSAGIFDETFNQNQGFYQYNRPYTSLSINQNGQIFLTGKYSAPLGGFFPDGEPDACDLEKYAFFLKLSSDGVFDADFGVQTEALGVHNAGDMPGECWHHQSRELGKVLFDSEGHLMTIGFEGNENYRFNDNPDGSFANRNFPRLEDQILIRNFNDQGEINRSHFQYSEDWECNWSWGFCPNNIVDATYDHEGNLFILGLTRHFDYDIRKFLPNGEEDLNYVGLSDVIEKDSDYRHYISMNSDGDLWIVSENPDQNELNVFYYNYLTLENHTFEVATYNRPARVDNYIYTVDLQGNLLVADYTDAVEDQIGEISRPIRLRRYNSQGELVRFVNSEQLDHSLIEHNMNQSRSLSQLHVDSVGGIYLNTSITINGDHRTTIIRFR